MVRKLERMSMVFFHGIQGMLEGGWTAEEIIEDCMHSLPDGRRLDEPTMTYKEAEEMFKTGLFPARFFTNE